MTVLDRLSPFPGVGGQHNKNLLTELFVTVRRRYRDRLSPFPGVCRQHNKISTATVHVPNTFVKPFPRISRRPHHGEKNTSNVTYTFNHGKSPFASKVGHSFNRKTESGIRNQAVHCPKRAVLLARDAWVDKECEIFRSLRLARHSAMAAVYMYVGLAGSTDPASSGVAGLCSATLT